MPERDYTDPIARLLDFTNEMERLCGEPAPDTGGLPVTAFDFLTREFRAYRQDLDQALLPLLKHRLRGLDDEEEDLQRELFLVSGQLAALDLEGTQRPPAAAAYREAWLAHLDAIENVILPAMHTRLSECDLRLLGQAMARHRGITWEAVEACPSSSQPS